MKTVSPIPTIPPHIFAPVQATHGMYAIKPYPQTAAIMEVLIDTLEEWKITPYRLSRLLGMRQCGLCYQWMRGVTKPSPYYCCLLLRLYQEVLFHGLKLVLVEAIDWSSGEIMYKGRIGNGRKRGSAVNGSAMAAFYDKLPA